MFDSTKEDLKDILRKADEGKLQLPDFQREYVWGDDDVKSLIASIAKGFPVGALLTLETGSTVTFKPRLLAGVPKKEVEPDELLLDGQQRITSLFQASFSKLPVRTRLRKTVEIERYYFLDIKKAVGNGADIIEAIVGVPADKVVRTNFGKDIEQDLSTPEKEYEQDMFPLNRAFDSRNWFYGWRDYWKPHSRDIIDLEREFYANVLEKIERYKMPIIRLDRKNTREAICLVFEKVNVGGKKLDAFELLTAIYAGDKTNPTNLRDEWSGNVTKSTPGIKQRLIGDDNPRKVLQTIASTDYLQSCTLLHTREVRLNRAKEGKKDKELPQIACNRQALLDLPLSAFLKFSKSIEAGFIDAAAFLNEQKIISPRDVPYPPQIVALASMFAILGKKAQNVPAKEKISRWFWSGALGELYGESAETRMANDLPGLVEWIADNGPAPKSIDDAIFQQKRLRSLRGRISAAYKAIHALLMRHGCRDFIHGDGVELMTFFNRKIDVHHVFPQKWCKQRKLDRKVYDSIINKTPLSKESNIAVSGDAPSMYLKRIEKKTGISSSALDDILRTHLIEPAFLRADDFEGFYNARMKALSDLIGKAMDKPVVEDRGSNENEIEVPDEDDLESPEETEADE